MNQKSFQNSQISAAFGAEGPIIMTGGAFGSIFAQFFHLSSAERKTLLVAGAAAGMSAIFGTPLAAVLLAIEIPSAAPQIPTIVNWSTSGPVHRDVRRVVNRPCADVGRPYYTLISLEHL